MMPQPESMPVSSGTAAHASDTRKKGERKEEVACGIGVDLCTDLLDNGGGDARNVKPCLLN